MLLESGKQYSGHGTQIKNLYQKPVRVSYGLIVVKMQKKEMFCREMLMDVDIDRIDFICYNAKEWIGVQIMAMNMEPKQRVSFQNTLSCLG